MNSLTNSLDFSLYIKPTNTFSYLQINSNHPNHIFKNIPKSLLIRIKRICSSYSDYLFFSRLLIFQLYQRGYNYNVLCSLSNIIGSLDRFILLPYKTRIKEKFNNHLLVPLVYNKTFPDMSNTIVKTWSEQRVNSILKNVEVKVISKIDLNLKSIYVFNLKPPFIFNYFTKPCLMKNCKICLKVLNFSYIKLNNTFMLPLASNSNCLSYDIVYIIFCSKCNSYYIGESKRSASTRINEHIYNINYFNSFGLKDTAVSYHFNLKNHILDKHFKFLIYKNGVSDIQSRKSIECDLINIFKNLNIKLMNYDVPNIYFKMTHFTFNV